MSSIINACDYIFGSDSRGTGKRWAKKVTKVDMSKTNGYAFIGDWLPREGETRLKEGDIILSTGWLGSNKYPENLYRIYEVQEGEVELLEEGNYKNLETLKATVREMIQKEEKMCSVAQLLHQIKHKAIGNHELGLLLKQLEEELEKEYGVKCIEV